MSIITHIKGNDQLSQLQIAMQQIYLVRQELLQISKYLGALELKSGQITQNEHITHDPCMFRHALHLQARIHATILQSMDAIDSTDRLLECSTVKGGDKAALCAYFPHNIV